MCAIILTGHIPRRRYNLSLKKDEISINSTSDMKQSIIFVEIVRNMAKIWFKTIVFHTNCVIFQFSEIKTVILYHARI